MRRGGFAAVVVFVLSLAGLANAAGTERRAAYDAGLVAQIEAKNHEAAAWFREAAAIDDQRDGRAFALYAKVSAAEPSFSPAIRRRAQILAGQGKRAEAIELAESALVIEKSPENRATLALALGADRASEAIAIMRAVTRERPNDVDDHLAWCQVALATSSLDDLQECSARAVALAPDEPEPHMFVALAAMLVDDRDAAASAMAAARSRELGPEQMAVLERMYDATETPRPHWGNRALIVVAAWLTGLAVLWAAGGVLSRRTPKRAA